MSKVEFTTRPHTRQRRKNAAYVCQGEWFFLPAPRLHVKGTVSHPDHKTILLQVWHKVAMNTEGQSKAMRHVVFLD